MAPIVFLVLLLLVALASADREPPVRGNPARAAAPAAPKADEQPEAAVPAPEPVAAVPVPEPIAVPEPESFEATSSEPAPIYENDEDDEPDFSSNPSARPDEKQRDLIEDSEDQLVSRDGEKPGEKPKLPARPAFTLHDYDPEKHTWVVPLDEMDTLKAYLETGYERARVANEDGPLMRSRSIFDMVIYALNPDEQEISNEEMDKIRTSVVEFKESQALHIDEQMELNLGFLNKGAPLRFVKNLYITMRNDRRADNAPGRRKLEAGEGRRHLEGLWEHEVKVDAVPTGAGFKERKFLMSGF
jgi:hypothetical protein